MGQVAPLQWQPPEVQLSYKKTQGSNHWKLPPPRSSKAVPKRTPPLNAHHFQVQCPFLSSENPLIRHFAKEHPPKLWDSKIPIKAHLFGRFFLVAVAGKEEQQAVPVSYGCCMEGGSSTY